MHKIIPISSQAKALESYFPMSKISRIDFNHIRWEGELQPNPNSYKYRIALEHVYGDEPKVFVLKPNILKRPQGISKLPHVYSTKQQQLCLYYPNGKEWNASKYFVHTIIPWASEWLFHYEIWYATNGIWTGGGVVHENEAEAVYQEFQRQQA